MNAPQTLVLDASVGVKWIRPEAGSDAARSLFVQATTGEVALVAPVHFAHEMLSVVKRELTEKAIVEAWQHIQASGIVLMPLTDELVAEAAVQCGALGCSFYDALAPACASLLDATLVSADRRAHAGYARLTLI